MIFWPTGNRRLWGSGRPQAAGKPSKKMGGPRPPAFWKVSRPPGAAQTPKIDDCRSAKKSYIKNPVVTTWVRPKAPIEANRRDSDSLHRCGTTLVRFWVTPGGLPGRSPAKKSFPSWRDAGGWGAAAPASGWSGGAGGHAQECWVPEGSLAGLFGCHEMALELVSGADFWCKLMSGAGPVDLGGSRGRSPA